MTLYQKYYTKDVTSHENFKLVLKYLKLLRTKGLGVWTGK